VNTRCLKRRRRASRGRGRRVGIIRASALWVLCRDRHKFHGTGAPRRLSSDLKPRTNRQAYSREEIIAELASVFVCATLGITPPSIDSHVAYIRFWIDALKQESRYLITAASKAQAAADFLTGLQPEAE
jgi:antirestriction protein ArdC